MKPALTVLSDVTWHDTPVSGERLRRLLMVLAESGPRGASAEHLIEDIWGEARPAHPAKALQILVSRARNTVGSETIARTPTGYRLALKVGEVDAWAADDLLDDAAAALAADDQNHARDLARRASSLDPSHQARRLLAVTDGLEPGESAIAEIEGLLNRSPHDEDLAAALLRMLSRTRGAASALVRYEEIRTRLADDLGTDPGPALEAIHRELLAADRPVRVGLRHATNPLVGRAEALAAVEQTLRAARLVTILGPGGLGKTRLATAVADTVHAPAVYFVSLADVRTDEAVLAAALDTVAGASTTAVPGTRLEVTRHPRDPFTSLAERLARIPSLLVLDNCEHLIDAAARLADRLLATVPDLRILTTSRTPLRITAERVFALDQLALPAARALFTERARAVRPRAALPTEVVDALVNRLDRLPLAIELAAARVRTMSPAAVLDNLTDRFGLLDRGERTVESRHRTLLAVIDWSWQLLDGPARRALTVLSLLPAGFGAEAAERILGFALAPSIGTSSPEAAPPSPAHAGPGSAGFSPGEVIDALDDLVDQSLVSVVETNDGVRFRMLETIREFGIRDLRLSGGLAAAEDAVRAWALDAGNRTLRTMFTADQIPGIVEIRAEESNLVDVLRRGMQAGDHGFVGLLAAVLAATSMTGDHDRTFALLSDAEHFFTGWNPEPEHVEAARIASALLTGTWAMLPFFESFPHTESVLKAVGPDSPNPHVAALTRFALEVLDAAAYIDDPQDVDVFVAHARSTNKYDAIVATPYASNALENAGLLDEAIDLTTHALSLLDDTDPPCMAAQLHLNSAEFHAQSGRFAGAVEHAEAAIPVFDRVSSRGSTRSMLAIAKLNLGRLDEAEAAFAEADRLKSGGDETNMRFLLDIGRAELVIAQGDAAGGLELMRSTIAETSELAAEWIRPVDKLDPWTIVTSGLLVAARARHENPADASGAHDPDFLRLVDTLTRATAPERKFYDLPAIGTATFGLATWMLLRTELDRDLVVDFLVFAHALDYSRYFPSMDWDTLVGRLVAGRRTELAERLEHASRTEPSDTAQALHEVLVRLGSMLDHG